MRRDSVRSMLCCLAMMAGLIGCSASATNPAPTAVNSALSMPIVSMTGLHVAGNQLQNGTGETLFLHGVNRGATEADCIRGNDYTFSITNQAYIDVIKSWNINAVRVTMNEDCWLGINTNATNAAYMGAAYQKAILNYVNLLTSSTNNLAVILDLHWSAPGIIQATTQMPMPDADHSTAFWKSVAATFSSNSAVIFDVFGEPYPNYAPGPQSSDANWECWLNGGSSCADPNTNMKYQVVGMQSLVSTIRSTGASNVIMLGGLQYANELSLWLKYKPADPLNNLAASWHVYYPDNYCSSLSCWNTYVAPVADQVPIIAGEFGAKPSSSGACSTVNLNTLWLFLESKKQGYLSWVFQPWGGDCSGGFNWSLISDQSGTPTQYGLLYYTHLIGLPSIYP